MKGRGAPPQWLLALLFVGLLGSALALFLVSPSARVAISRPLVSKPQRGPLVVVPLDRSESPLGTSVYHVALSGKDLRVLAAHDELWIPLSAPGVDGHLLGAAMRARGTPCVFYSAGGAKLGDSTLV